MSNNVKLAALGALFIGLCGAASTDAFGTSSHMTYLTFNRAVALPGVQLPAGSYVFEAISSQSPDVVLVRTRDRSRVIIMKNTHRIDRPVGQSRNATVSFGEAAAGEAPPIRAWFPEDSDRGYQFIYRW
jgi:hypothetical protein